MEKDNLNLWEFRDGFNWKFKRAEFEYGYETDISLMINKIAGYEPNWLLETIFERFVESEDTDVRENILHAVRCLLMSVKDKLNSLNDIYAMLRMAFDDTPNYIEVSLAVIEELRDKISLQILIDSINSDSIPEIYMDYAQKVQKELEEELAELEDETSDK